MGYNKEEYPFLIEDIVLSLKLKIQDHNIECILVFIVRESIWSSRQEFIEVYSMILGALSKEIREYYDLQTVCIIQDPLMYQGFNASKNYIGKNSGLQKKIQDISKKLLQHIQTCTLYCPTKIMA